MSKRHALVPEAEEALRKLKQETIAEIAEEHLNHQTSSAGMKHQMIPNLGGEMVRKMIQQTEEKMAQKDKES